MPTSLAQIGALVPISIVPRGGGTQDCVMRFLVTLLISQIRIGKTLSFQGLLLVEQPNSLVQHGLEMQFSIRLKYRFQKLTFLNLFLKWVQIS